MKPRINILTVAVSDLDKSLAFYRDGLGLPSEGSGDAADHVAFELEGGLFLVLHPRAAPGRDAQENGASPGSADFTLTHFVSARQEVDTLLERAEAAGATLMGRPGEQPWGYSGQFKDLDGHRWEVMWSPDFEAVG